MSFNLLRLATYFLLVFSLQVQSEIYQWVDSKGRIQFSDNPNKKYNSTGYAQKSSSDSSVTATESYSERSENLEEIAKSLKKDRIKREAIRKNEVKARAKKNKKRKKLLAAIKKKKLACKNARKKEDLAFRKRTKSQSLAKMRKALANYEKKRETRRKKCND
jgi:hypothetical protein